MRHGYAVVKTSELFQGPSPRTVPTTRSALLGQIGSGIYFDGLQAPEEIPWGETTSGLLIDENFRVSLIALFALVGTGAGLFGRASVVNRFSAGPRKTFDVFTTGATLCLAILAIFLAT